MYIIVSSSLLYCTNLQQKWQCCFNKDLCHTLTGLCKLYSYLQIFIMTAVLGCAVLGCAVAT